MDHYIDALTRIPQQYQQQCSTSDQTMALMVVLDRIGLHGALEYLREKDASRFSRMELNRVVDESLVLSIGPLPAVEGLDVRDELGQARRVAVRFGLYDAADLVRLYAENMNSEVVSTAIMK